jgi:two-component system sensor histidine kinase KdpD
MARRRVRTYGLTALEVAAATAVASLGVAVLDGIAPAVGLGVVYLLAVAFVAFRRGEVPAIATAVLSVLVFNFLFIDPRYRLAISQSDDLVALGVFLVVASVVSRLAATARARAEEAQARAREAERHERVARLLADAASSLLAGGPVEQELAREPSRLSAAFAQAGLRVSLSPVPAPRSGELSTSLKTSTRSGWLYGDSARGWDRDGLERLCEPLRRLFDLALERERVAERSAEAEAATRADVAKTAVLHAISHDLRSPLTAITTALTGLRDAQHELDRDELLSVLDEEVQRLNRMVSDLLDLSRIEAGALHPQTDWCDLRDVVTSALADARSRRGDHPVEFRMPDDLPLVRADAAQVERVFANLIENAFKFSADGAPVEIGGGTGGSKVFVRVANRGRSIPQSQRRYVFEPFFRGREGAVGAGLGLAICRGFVEANGGQIALQSAREGATAFMVSFPLTRQPSMSHER